MINKKLKIVFVDINKLQLLWENDYFDGPLSGILRYEGKICWFDKAFYPDVIEDNNISYESPDVWQYDIYELTDDQVEYEMNLHKDFEKYVGEHTNAIGNSFDHGEARLLKPKELHRLFYDKHPSESVRKYRNNKYIGSFFMKKGKVVSKL